MKEEVFSELGTYVRTYKLTGRFASGFCASAFSPVYSSPRPGLSNQFGYAGLTFQHMRCNSIKGANVSSSKSSNQ